MHFKVSKEAAEILENFAKGNHITRTEALTRAVALLALADEQKKHGKFLGLVKEDDDGLHAVGRVLGVLEGR